jgi:lysozyme
VSAAVTDLRAQLMRDETLRLKPYTDTTGHLTIGYGHNLTEGIPEAIASALLDYDITVASADLFSHLPWTMQLDEVRRAVLLAMTFNLGIGGLLEFRKFLAHVQAGQWAAAAVEMLDSVWATQVGPRAHRLAKQMETGAWV